MVCAAVPMYLLSLRRTTLMLGMTTTTTRTVKIVSFVLDPYCDDSCLWLAIDASRVADSPLPCSGLSLVVVSVAEGANQAEDDDASDF
jgi:hypothetical protein